ncbi:uncharacterized protein LOC141686234 [Apium graveolens]|uniref:uncharacterized protein LOC141686234 n=1 Tax=Apium graveolens TaxID=4045 RepID=UPI003D7A7990
MFDSSNNHIQLDVKERNGSEWRLTGFYGYPERERRQESRNFIRSLASASTLPWCVLGDFNDLMHNDEKKGRHQHPQNLLDRFRNTIEDCSLIEVDLKGGDFTWEKSKGTTNWVQERLDRCFASSDWWSRFPLCTLTGFHAIVSDHEPIKLELNREDDDGVQMYFDAKDKLDDLLSHEEAYWKQRAKSFWLKDGDTNSKYFHAVASSRKKLNYLAGLKNEEGSSVTNHDDMCILLKNYFTKVFTEDGG